MAVQIPCLRCRATAVADDDAQSVACPSCSLPLPPPSAAAWMVARDGGEPFGPYTVGQLRDYVAGGNVLPTDNLWFQGAPGWMPAGQLAALAPGGAAVAPQPPQQPAYGQPFGGHPQYGQAGSGQPAYGQPHGAAFGQPYGGPYQAPNAMGQGSSAMNFGLHFRRAFNWNLRTLPVQPDEEAELIATSVDEENARRYLVWRRSVLLTVTIPLLVAALLGLIGAFTGGGFSGMSVLGILVQLLRVAILFLLPATAFLSAQSWSNHRKSRRVLLIGWLIGFLTPLVLALIPVSWLVDMRTVEPGMMAQAGQALGLIGAIAAFVTLMPSVLSLIPGVLRGCLRIKALLPQSILPGMFLIAATPLYVLLFLVIFTTINQLAGNLLLILAVLLLASSPIVYIINAKLFSRPIRSDEEFRRVGTVQTVATGISLLGLFLMLIYLFTGEVFNKHIVGFDYQTSLLRPWNTTFLQLPIEYFFRSMFTTVIVADLFMLMNLQLWRQNKAFEGTDDARHYDRIMSEIEEAGGAGSAPGDTASPTPQQ